MSIELNKNALRLGQKEFRNRLSDGAYPYLPVLDDILYCSDIVSEYPLGLVQIPSELIVGTKTAGRTTAFAANFMPLLKPDSEFAAKWEALCESHLHEGIRDPIKAYEFMNHFYVEEGNKRVSVLKYYDAVTIPGYVTRIVPRRSNNKKNKIYYEFLDFYKCNEINYLWFSKLGGFTKLQKLVGKKPGYLWSVDVRKDFFSF